VAAYQPGDTVDGFIERADQALYDAKKLGKNLVIIREDRPVKTEEIARKLCHIGGQDFSTRVTLNQIIPNFSD
jgi:predicted signal transduction protein with EAL and GGDEF domain